MQLTKEGIQPFAAFFTAAQDDFCIIGGNHHGRELAYMLGKAFIMFIVEGNIFFAVFEGAYDFAFVIIFIENSFQAEAVGQVMCILGFAACKVAFSEAEVINSIEQIRFAGAVASGDADDTFIESEVFSGIIFKLDK